MGNLRIEHLELAAVGVAEQGGNLLCVVRAVVHHRQQDTVDFQFGIDLPPHLGDGLQKLFQALCGKVLRLNGNQHAVRSCQRVDGQHTQRGHTIQKNIVVIFFDHIQVLFQNRFTAHGVDQRYLHARKLDVRGHEVYAFLVPQNPFFGVKGLVPQDVLHDLCNRVRKFVRLGMSETDGQGTLRVEICQ